MNLYLDSEFTGLHQPTTLISLAFVAEDGRSFYAEFSDYDKSQCDPWILEHVIESSWWISKNADHGVWEWGHLTCCYGDTAMVRAELDKWLSAFGEIEVWSDCLAFDWVLFCQLYGGAFGLPGQIYYIPFDICTLFKVHGIDPDVDRKAFAGKTGVKHNALHDAQIIKACYDKLVTR